MSYCRWSTIIGSSLTPEEEIKLIMDDVPIADRIRIGGGEQSDWYCFDNVNGCASVWHVSAGTIDWEWEDLLEAYLLDRIAIQYDESLTQEDFLYDIVYDMLEDHYNEQF